MFCNIHGLALEVGGAGQVPAHVSLKLRLIMGKVKGFLVPQVIKSRGQQ